MGKESEIKGKAMIDATERFEKIRKAVKARDCFLAEHPELISFQKEIQRRLRCAGSMENRMTILRSMMEDKLLELSQTCLEAKESWENNR
jgi:hypothetical protein